MVFPWKVFSKCFVSQQSYRDVVDIAKDLLLKLSCLFSKNIEASYPQLNHSVEPLFCYSHICISFIYPFEVVCEYIQKYSLALSLAIYLVKLQRRLWRRRRAFRRLCKLGRSPSQLPVGFWSMIWARDAFGVSAAMICCSCLSWHSCKSWSCDLLCKFCNRYCNGCSKFDISSVMCSRRTDHGIVN